MSSGSTVNAPESTYWTKWGGVDLAGKAVRLPQYNWGSREFHEEVEKMVRFWMDTGIDGMMIDAVNWYVGCDWPSQPQVHDQRHRQLWQQKQPAGRGRRLPRGSGAVD